MADYPGGEYIRSETFSPFINVTMESASCKATLMVAIDTVFDPQDFMDREFGLTEKWYSQCVDDDCHTREYTGAAEWLACGDETKHSRYGIEKIKCSASGTAECCKFNDDDSRYNHTVPGMITELEAALMQCPAESTASTCQAPVTMQVATQLLTEASECHEWFPKVDNAMRARLNALRSERSPLKAIAHVHHHTNNAPSLALCHSPLRCLTPLNSDAYTDGIVASCKGLACALRTVYTNDNNHDALVAGGWRNATHNFTDKVQLKLEILKDSEYCSDTPKDDNITCHTKDGERLTRGKNENGTCGDCDSDFVYELTLSAFGDGKPGLCEPYKDLCNVPHIGPRYLQQGCAKTCGMCEGQSGDSQAGDSQVGSCSTESGCSDCSDAIVEQHTNGHETSCADLKAHGFCEDDEYGVFAQGLCPSSCGVCPADSKTDSEDKDEDDDDDQGQVTRLASTEAFAVDVLGQTSFVNQPDKAQHKCVGQNPWRKNRDKIDACTEEMANATKAASPWPKPLQDCDGACINLASTLQSIMDDYETWQQCGLQTAGYRLIKHCNEICNASNSARVVNDACEGSITADDFSPEGLHKTFICGINGHPDSAISR